MAIILLRCLLAGEDAKAGVNFPAFEGVGGFGCPSVEQGFFLGKLLMERWPKQV
jgi:hypothetical protein